jgi:hypothetical protein
LSPQGKLSPWLWPAAPVGWLIHGVLLASLGSIIFGVNFFAAWWLMIKFCVAAITVALFVIGLVLGFIAIKEYIEDNNLLPRFLTRIFSPVVWMLDSTVKLVNHILFRELTEEEKIELWNKHNVYQQKMICSSTPDQPYVGPRKPFNLRNWITLLFYETKAKVCKPFPE